MIRVFAIVVTIPLAGCLEADPGLIDTFDIQSFNFSLGLSQQAPAITLLGATGEATYSGQVGMEVSETNSGMSGNVIGDAIYNVSFDDDLLTARFDNMVLGTSAGRTSNVTGSLAIEANMVSGRFGGSLTGTIGMQIDGDERHIDLDLDTFGQFHGYTLVTAPGDLVGSASGQSTGEATVDFDLILYYGDLD